MYTVIPIGTNNLWRVAKSAVFWLAVGYVFGAATMVGIVWLGW